MAGALGATQRKWWRRVVDPPRSCDRSAFAMLREVEGSKFAPPLSGCTIIRLRRHDLSLVMAEVNLAVAVVDARAPAISAGPDALEGAYSVMVLAGVPGVLLSRGKAQVAAPIVKPVAVNVVNNHSLLAAHNDDAESNRVFRAAVPILNVWTKVPATARKPDAASELVEVFPIHKDYALGSLDLDHAIRATGDANTHRQAAVDCAGTLTMGSASTLGSHQRGIPPLALFQLDTVDGVRSSAAATLTVPPRSSIV